MDETPSSQPTPRPRLGSGLAGGALGGAAVGALGAWATLAANGSLETGRDRLVFGLFVAAAAAACALPLGVLAELLLGRHRRPGPGAAAWGVVAFALGYLAVERAIGAVAPWRMETAPADLALGAVGGLVVLLLARPLAARLSRPLATAALATLAVAALGLAAAADHGAHARSEPVPVEDLPDVDGCAERVVLLGIDGADWRTIDPLLEAGAMPNLARILGHGVRAPLRVDRPTWSPVLWTTIATGVGEDEHGVSDFTELVLPGMASGLERAGYRYGERPRVPRGTFVVPIVEGLRELGLARDVPITARHRRAPAVWNLAGRAGIEVGVVNWYATWPCEVVRGCMVADHDPSDGSGHRLTEAVEDGAGGFTYPPDLIEELDPLLPSWWPRSPSPAEVEEILAEPLFEGHAEEVRDAYISETVADLGNSYLGDRFAAEAGIHLLEHRDVQLACVYLPGVDRVSHRAVVSPETLGPVLDAYHRHVDDLLEPYADLVEEGRTLLVIVSDHGWEYTGRIGHELAPDGIFVAAGAGVRAGAALAEKPHLLDVAPTVLAALGCPVRQGMSGRLLAELFDDPPARVEAEFGPYHPEWSVRPEDLDAGSLDAKLDELQRLGYVDR